MPTTLIEDMQELANILRRANELVLDIDAKLLALVTTSAATLNDGDDLADTAT